MKTQRVKMHRAGSRHQRYRATVDAQSRPGLPARSGEFRTGPPSRSQQIELHWPHTELSSSWLWLQPPNRVYVAPSEGKEWQDAGARLAIRLLRTPLNVATSTRGSRCDRRCGAFLTSLRRTASKVPPDRAMQCPDGAAVTNRGTLAAPARPGLGCGRARWPEGHEG